MKEAMVVFNKIQQYVFMFLLMTWGFHVHAIEKTPHTLPAALNYHANNLVLNGIGTRNKFFIDVYHAGLYLKNKSSDGAAIILADEPMAIRIVVISSLITGERMAKATHKGFKKVAGDRLETIQEEVDRLISAFKDEIELGDYFDLVYTPETGTQVYKNGQLQTHVDGLDFKQILFSIWLSNKSVQAKMRDNMLQSN